jgi:hypothetical protein
MKLHKIALAVLLGAASMAASAADSSQAADNVGSLSSANKNTESEALRIVQPKAGKVIAGETSVKAVVRVGNEIHPKSLRITLNGKNVTRHTFKETCGPDACRWAVELTKAEGLFTGQNQLVAFARGSDRSIKIERAEFFYEYGLGSGQDQPQWNAPSVGLSLNPGGAQPWVTLTTGWPGDIQDNLDPTQYSLPYRDMTFPLAKDTPCTSRYQVVVLNRATPMQEDDYMCPRNAAELKSDLAGLTKGTEIVLVGTTVNNNVDSGLDTTSIGGTNYLLPWNWQPMGYTAIGISGAAPGSAYESYYVSSDLGKPYMKVPFADGVLAKDQNYNYNFHAGNNLQFEVYPNNPNNGTSNVFINYSGDVHGWGPPVGSTNGFWLLTLDRVTLLPSDANTTSGSPCQPQGYAEHCGQFFQTGSQDANISAAAIQQLTTALQNGTSRQLMFLVTVNQPFQPGAELGGLVPAVNLLGGAGYVFAQLTTYNSTYTLVATGRVYPNGFYATGKSPFSGGTVNSSSAFSQQGQTGFVRGVMARDNNSLYLPSVVSQEDGKMNGEGATTLSIDYDFYTISSQMPIDWPLTDSPGHMAAYHWASQQFLSNHYGKSQPPDPLSADVRYWYHSPTRASDMAKFNTDFLCPNTVTDSPCDYPGDGNGFTTQELTDIDAELYTEFTALHDTDLYLGSSGIGGLVQGTYGNGGVISDQVIDATYEVLKDQVMPVTANTSVTGAAYDWMNMAAGLTSIASVALGPLGYTEAAALMGATSGALWSGSALGPFATNDPATPPSYENGFDTTLGAMEEQASVYSGNLALSYDSSLDNIYSDWGKLSATGAKTANSANGWYFDSNVSVQSLGNKLADGVRRSIYSQLLPQFYGVDTYVQQPVTDIDKLGMYYSSVDLNTGLEHSSCTASYPSSTTSNALAYRTYPSVSKPGTTDMFVIGGTIDYQNTKNVTESLPSDSLLNVLFGSDSGDLNIPQDLLYDTSLLPGRNGPSEGSYPWGNQTISQCFKPGCSETSSTQSTCVGP